MSEPVRVLLVTGSTRAGSGNTAALATVAAVAPRGVTAVMYDGLARLPAFNPDDDGVRVPREVAELRDEIAAADAVLFCTPEYAGTLPGSFKNLLDWTVGRPAVWQARHLDQRGRPGPGPGRPGRPSGRARLCWRRHRRGCLPPHPSGPRRGEPG
ncbi:MAG: NADPH-dependent FMN reductase, partial [Trebonia sp.]